MARGRLRFGAERRWLMAMVVAVLVPLAAFQALNVETQRQTQRAHEEAVLARIAESVGDRLDQELTAASRLLLSLAAAPQLSEPGDPACPAILARVAATQPRYTNFSVVDESRHIVCSSGPLPAPVDVRGSVNIRTAFATKTLGLSDFKLGPLTGRPVIVLSQPLFDAGGAVTGTLNTGLSLDWLQAHLATRNLPEAARVSVVSRTGMVLASSDSAQPPGSDVPPAVLARDEALLDREASATLAVATDVTDGTIHATLAVGGLPSGALVTVERPEAVALAGIDTLAHRWFGAFAVLALVSLGAMYLTVERLLLRRLDSLSTAARGFSEGRYDTRADIWRDGSGIAGLAADMDAMAAALEAREASLRTALADMTRARAETARFAYIAAHDLQEPLRAIGGFTRLLDRALARDLTAAAGNGAAPDARRYMGRIVSAAERMRLMFRDLMDYAALESAPRRCDRVDLDILVTEAAAGLSNAAVHRRELPVVAGDPAQLRRLIDNLLQNAATFAGNGHRPAEITVSARRSGSFWEIAVGDDGPGIPPKDRETVFQLFKTLPPDADAAGGRPGTGTGLAIARRIAELHGGRMWIEAADETGVDKGCVVRFTIDGAAPPDTAAPGGSAPAERSTRSPDGAAAA